MSGGGYLAPEYIRRLTPYPGGQPADLLCAELGVPRLLYLAANENTTGPSPRVVEVIRRLAGDVHHYPDGGGYHLRRRLAECHELEREQVILGSGSAEVVELLCRTFVTPGQRVVIPRLGFIQFRLSAQVSGADVLLVPPVAGSRRDDAVALAEASRGARLVFIANPNNPTGTFLTRQELDAYFERADPGALTVVDQAYQEYVDDPAYPDALDDLRSGRNLLVLHTFSKLHGLAGLRIGYGLGPASVLAQMERARLVFNTTSVAQAAALAALEDVEHAASVHRRNAAERRFLSGELTRRGFAVTPPAANFLLVDPPVDPSTGAPRAAGGLIQGLRARGILVCPTGVYGLASSFRVTIGIREENEQLLAALDELLSQPPAR